MGDNQRGPSLRCSRSGGGGCVEGVRGGRAGGINEEGAESEG
jgi:hypothetical protein